MYHQQHQIFGSMKQLINNGLFCLISRSQLINRSKQYRFYQYIPQMKSVIVLLVALQLASCVTELPSQGQLFNDDVRSKLQESSVGRIILKLTQLRSVAQQFDFSKLFDALDELDQGLRDRLSEENDEFQQYAVQYNADTSYYGNQITEYDNDVATHEVDIQDLVGTRISFEQTLTTKNHELSDAQTLRATVAARQASGRTTFEAQVAEYNQAAEAIDQALELLSSARDGAFIEYSKSQLVGAHLEKKLVELSSRRTLYQPLIEAFLTLSANNFADNEVLTKIIKLLQELRNNVGNSRTSLVNTFDADNNALQDQLNNYDEIINNLSNIVIPQLQTDIEGKAAEVVSKQTLLSDAKNNLQAAQDNARVTEDRWVQRQKQNTDLVSEYNNQLVVVATAVTHLQRAGIKRP